MSKENIGVGGYGSIVNPNTINSQGIEVKDLSTRDSGELKLETLKGRINQDQIDELSNKAGNYLRSEDFKNSIRLVRIEGLKRKWNVFNHIKKSVVLGVEPKKNSSCNGVVLPVTKEIFDYFKIKENRYDFVNYKKQTEILDGREGGANSLSKIFLSMPKEGGGVEKDMTNYKIPFSYLLTNLTGFLKWGKNDKEKLKFAEEFIKTTGNWHYGKAHDLGFGKTEGEETLYYEDVLRNETLASMDKACELLMNNSKRVFKGDRLGDQEYIANFKAVISKTGGYSDKTTLGNYLKKS